MAFHLRTVALQGAQEQELSEEEDAISQRRAALLIIEARSAACQQELDDLLAQAADLTTRVAAAEAAYTSADAIASAAMAAAEAAVRDELETSAVCNQVKTAMANAMASLKALDTPPASAKTAAASASLDAAAAVVSKPASEVRGSPSRVAVAYMRRTTVQALLRCLGTAHDAANL